MRFLKLLVTLLLCLLLSGCAEEKRVLSELCPVERETVTCIDLWNQDGSCCMGNPDYLAKTWAILDTAEYGTEMQTGTYDPMGIYHRFWFYVGEEPTMISLSEDYSQWIPDQDTSSGTYQYYPILNPEALKELYETHIDIVYNREGTVPGFAGLGQPYAWIQGLTPDALSQVRLGYSRSSGGSTGGAISSVAFEELSALLKSLPENALTNPETIGDSGTDRIRYVLSEQPNLAVSFLDAANDLGVVVRYYEDPKDTAHLEFLMLEGADNLSPDSGKKLSNVHKWDIESPELLEWFRKMSAYPPYAQMVTGHWLDFDKDALKITDGETTLNVPTITGWTYEITEPSKDSDSFGVRFRPPEETEGWIYLSFWPEGYVNTERNRYLNHSTSGYTSYSLTVLYPNGMDTKGAPWSVAVDYYENGDYAIINEGAEHWFERYAEEIYIQTLYVTVAAGKYVEKDPPEMVIDPDYTQSDNYEEGFKQFDLQTADRAYLSLSGWEECGWVHDDTPEEENVLLTFWPQYETEGMVCVEYHEGFFTPPEEMTVEETILHITAYGGAHPAYRGTLPGHDRWTYLWFNRNHGSYVFRFENTDHWTERKVEECLWALSSFQFRG